MIGRLADGLVTYQVIVVFRVQDVGCVEKSWGWNKQRVNCKLGEQKPAWSCLSLWVTNSNESA